MAKSTFFLFLVENLSSVTLCFSQIGSISATWLIKSFSRLRSPLLGDELCALQGALALPEGGSLANRRPGAGRGR